MSTPIAEVIPVRDPASNSVPVGTWLKIPSMEPAEIMAYAGLDFVVVDLEHSPIGLETAYRIINIARSSGLTALVRVPDAGASTIQKVLDAGAHGILVPHVESGNEATRVAAAVRFPPAGVRGAGGTSRAGRWGLLPTADYLAEGNFNALCIPQLESEAAISAAPEILAVAGVNAIFVGAADLALSLGVTPSHPRVQELIDQAISAAHAAGKPCGLAFGSRPDAARKAAGSGCDFVMLSNDTSMMAEMAIGLIKDFQATAPEAHPRRNKSQQFVSKGEKS